MAESEEDALDGGRFDRLIRSFTRSTSRRAALGALLGTGLLGLEAESGRAAKTCGGSRARCKRSRDCCKGLDCRVGGKCRYKNKCGGNDGDYCEENKDCCDGFKCRKAANKCRACNAQGQTCSLTVDCCPGLACSFGRCRG